MRAIAHVFDNGKGKIFLDQKKKKLVATEESRL